METYIMLAMGVGSMIISYIYFKQRRFLRLIMTQYEEVVTRMMQQEFSTKVRQRKQAIENILDDLENKNKEGE